MESIGGARSPMKDWFHVIDLNDRERQCRWQMHDVIVWHCITPDVIYISIPRRQQIWSNCKMIDYMQQI